MISKRRRSMRTNINPFLLNNTTNNNPNHLSVNNNQIDTLANIQLYDTEIMDNFDETVTNHQEDEFNNFFGKAQERNYEEIFEETQPFEGTSLIDSNDEIVISKHKNATRHIYNGSTV